MPKCGQRGEWGAGLASTLGVNVPQTHQTFHIAACLERKAPPQSSPTHSPAVRGRALRSLKVPIPSLTGKQLGCRPAMNSLGAWSLHGVRKLC